MNIRRNKLLLAVLLAAILLTSCRSYRTKEGLIRDTIYSVEQSNNGSWKVYMTHDDISTFCTYNAQLGQKALDLLENYEGESFIKFRAVNETDPEWSFWNGSDCKTSNAADITMFMLLDVNPAPGHR